MVFCYRYYSTGHNDWVPNIDRFTALKMSHIQFINSTIIAYLSVWFVRCGGLSDLCFDYNFACHRYTTQNTSGDICGTCYIISNFTYYSKHICCNAHESDESWIVNRGIHFVMIPFTICMFGDTMHVLSFMVLELNEWYHQIDGFAQDCRNVSSLAMELLQYCTKPYICIAHRWSSAVIHFALANQVISSYALQVFSYTLGREYRMMR